VKLLLDHCVPKRLGGELRGHVFKTAFQMGWADFDNGALMAKAADKQFDAFITVDQHIRFQRNLAALPLPVLILVAPDNKLATLQPLVPFVLETLTKLSMRTLYRIHPKGRIEIVSPGA
jgi:hypothetical protein